jgi:hypothetical protein
VIESMRESLRGVVDVEEALRLIDLARGAVREGVIGYALITGRVADDVSDRGAASNAGSG